MVFRSHGQILLAALYVTAALGLGCSSSGKEMNQSSVSQIQKGVTTRQEVESQLGPPTSTSLMPDGRRMMTYMHHESKMHGASFIPVVGGFFGGADRRSQVLQIYVKKDGIVEDYEFSDTSSEIKNWGGEKNIRPTNAGK